MAERTRNEIDRRRASAGGALFADAPPDDTSATVQHGPFAERLPVAGMTVAQVRARFSDRFDIHPQSQAYLDGEEVDDHRVIDVNQVLTFLHRAGEKGASAGKVEGAARCTVLLDGDTARVESPEGQNLELPVPDFMETVTPRLPQTGELILPDGVRSLVSVPGGLVLVHETPPAVHNLRWIAADSVEPYGPEARYRSARTAFPYLIVVAMYRRNGDLLELTNWNECFFRTGPLTSHDDRLLVPALLNCSRYPGKKSGPVSWICTQNMDWSTLSRERDPNRRLRRDLGALLEHLLATGFNLSSDIHEGKSGFTETVETQVDPRVSSIDAWEQATAANPLFVLDVPWIDAGVTLRDVLGRIGRGRRMGRGDQLVNSDDVARRLFNRKPAKSRARRAGS